jgi:hypothetical protein
MENYLLQLYVFCYLSEYLAAKILVLRACLADLPKNAIYASLIVQPNH